MSDLTLFPNLLIFWVVVFSNSLSLIVKFLICLKLGNLELTALIAELIKLDDVEDTVIKYSCDFEEFWIINFDYMKNFEIYENVCVYIDIKTGEMSYITY